MSASLHLQGWLGFRSFRMRLILMVWPTFHGIRSYVFKQRYAMAAESQKVPLEIFFNPTILSDDNLFSEFSNFFTPSLAQGGGMLMGRQKGMKLESWLNQPDKFTKGFRALEE